MFINQMSCDRGLLQIPLRQLLFVNGANLNAVAKHSGFPQWKDSIGCEEICDYRITEENKKFHSVLS